MRTYMNWSGGKDSSLCLHRALASGQYKVDCLITNINAAYDRISMHGVRRELLEAQAEAIGIPLQTIELPEQPSMEEYEHVVIEKTIQLKQSGFTHSLFGDIFLEDLRDYREKKLKSLGISAVFPLWKTPSLQLMQEFIQLGFRGLIVCVNEKWLDRSFCGRLLDESFIRDLPQDVDPCGENGEYHSYVFDGPIFKDPVPFRKGELVYRKYAAPAGVNSPAGPMVQPSDYGFYFLDLKSPNTKKESPTK